MQDELGMDSEAYLNLGFDLLVSGTCRPCDFHKEYFRRLTSIYDWEILPDVRPVDYPGEGIAPFRHRAVRRPQAERPGNPSTSYPDCGGSGTEQQVHLH